MQTRILLQLVGCMVVTAMFCYVGFKRTDTKYPKPPQLSALTRETLLEHQRDIHNIQVATISDGPKRATRMCKQSERLAHMERFCNQSFHAAKSTLMTPVGRSLVDYKHRLTFCWMSKAGCTSLKAYILEANGLDVNEKSAGDSLNKVHFADTVNRYGVKQMHQLSEKERWDIVSSFFNVFSIRNPFDRLVSYYRDKLVDKDRSSNHPDRQAEILRYMRPEIFHQSQSLSEMKYPQDILGPPRFDEFMYWAYKMKKYDEHWSFITETCHPCAHQWGAVFRIETMARDGQILRGKLESNDSGPPVRHSHEGDRDYSKFDRYLPIYENVTSEVVDYWLDVYRTDMEMFGYQWDRTHLVATCSIDTPDGPCC